MAKDTGRVEKFLMYSISEIAKALNLTARTLRHYEEKGLIESVRRGEGGYRYYSQETFFRIEEIKKFKRMKFSLTEIKSFLDFNGKELESLLNQKLRAKLVSIGEEEKRLLESKEEVQDQLLAMDSFFKGKFLERGQRRVLMEAIKNEVLKELQLKREINSRDLEYLKREDYLFDTPDKRDFISAVKKCLNFARDEGIRLGPARGAAPASLSLYALGWGSFDPSEYDLVPERLEAINFQLHIDVEFKNGQRFVDFCKGVSQSLKVGRIEAFKLPLLDIIENVHERLGQAVDYDGFDDNDPIILDQFRNGEIDRIFSFDIPKETLLAKYMDDNFYKSGEVKDIFKKYLKSQVIHDFRDLLNIEAIFRPDNLEKKPFMREYIDRYPKAKKVRHYYKCLTPELNEFLDPNFGVIIYQEDIIHILNSYTSWNYRKCNDFRRSFASGEVSEEQKKDLLSYLNQDVYDLLEKESPVVFCKAHSIGAWPKLIKATAVLKAIHKEIYFEEIEKWEKKNGYSWGDFGFISDGVSLLQQ